MTAEIKFIASELGREEQDVMEDEEYYRKTAMYNAIFKGLRLNDWLYDKDDMPFTRFALPLSYVSIFNCAFVNYLSISRFTSSI